MSISYIFFLMLILVIGSLLVVGFNTVGFKLYETLTILIVSTAAYLSSFPSILFYFRGWVGFGVVIPDKIFVFQKLIMVERASNLALGFDIAGFLIPAIISIKMIVDRRSPITAILIGIVIVSFLAYLSSNFVPGKGILINNIYILSLVASILGIVLSNKHWERAGPIAYVSGSLGVLIGADLVRTGEIISYQSNVLVVASIGGAGVLDAIFLVGIVAVIIDVIFVNYVGLVRWITRRLK